MIMAADATPPADPLAIDLRGAASQLVEGTIIDGKYRIESILGRGAMGVVAAATHLALREKVALKFLFLRGDGDPDFRVRFRREAHVSARLKNEHVTRVIDVGTWNDKALFMVMEHLTGTDLRNVVRDSTPMSVERAVDYLVQICEGMAEAHALGILHRDLKPSNLFVTKRPDGTDLVKILDFGVSKWATQEGENDDLTMTGAVVGSLKYMSPEQLLGAGDLDPRTDVWAIGSILFEMLVGRPPYDFPNVAGIYAALASGRPPPSMKEQRPSLPAALDAVVAKALRRDRDDRFANVAELAAAALAAVESPFAEHARRKLLATLGTASGAEPLTTTAGLTFPSSGSYLAVSPASTRGDRISVSPERATARAKLAPLSTIAAGAAVVLSIVAILGRSGTQAATLATASLAGMTFASVGPTDDPSPPPGAAATPATATAPIQTKSKRLYKAPTKSRKHVSTATTATSQPAVRAPVDPLNDRQ